MSEAALEAALKRLIALEGPIPVERYMALCLGDRQHGYYTTRDPFGAAGDFITAPEISQMFGELIGLWAAAIWQMMGAPTPVHLVELGPGRGTLMADALRAANVLPAFAEALQIHLVETSPVLRAVQERALCQATQPIRWHDAIDTLPDGPAIIIANEFLDALPVRQFQRTERGWHERLIGLGERGELVFGLSPESVGLVGVPDAPDGAVFERCEAGLAMTSVLAVRIAGQGGAALFIDYGHTRQGFGDTLQALRRHAFADVLSHPGEADLTAHVDFQAMAAAARAAGAAVSGPVTQRDFLLDLGLGERCRALIQAARSPEQASEVESAYARLTDGAPTGMGALFKVMGFAQPGLSVLPGFGNAAGDAGRGETT